MTTLRPARSEDASAIAALRLQSAPYLTINTETVAHRIAHPEKRELSLVAERDGEVAGHGSAWLDIEGGPGAATLILNIDQRHRRRGIGTTLHDALLQHCRELETSTIYTDSRDDAGGAFARTRGFTPGRVEWISHLSLEHIPEVEVPQGFTFTPLSALESLNTLHTVDSAVVGDVPSDGNLSALSFTDWKQRYVSDGKLNHDCTVLAFAGAEPAGVAWLDSAEKRVWSGLTGTIARFRGRGLAKSMKVASLRLARKHGFTDAYASNDSTNAPMLAVNQWLGYRPIATCLSWHRELN